MLPLELLVAVLTPFCAPEPLPSLPSPFGGFAFILFSMLITIAPPAAAPNVPTGVDDLIPNISFINFSAGTKKPSATIAYNIFVVAKSIAFPINKVYSKKCTGCIRQLNMYSLSQKLKACALLSFILSSG